MTTCSPAIEHGARVQCFRGSIDERAHNGSTGIVTGFARFSSYHAREAIVRFDDGKSEWFWVRDLKAI